MGGGGGGAWWGVRGGGGGRGWSVGGGWEQEGAYRNLITVYPPPYGFHAI